MAITTGYFNSNNGDRKYNAETISKYFIGILTRGVLANYKNGFVVKANNTMSVQVQPGKAFFSDGKWVESDTIEPLTIDASDIALSRIDRIVLHKDKSDGVRNTTLIVKKGTPASNPVAPVCENDNYIEELSLATVRIAARATSISQGNITDTRPDSDICGYVTGAIDQLDLTDAYLQYQSGYEELIAQNQTNYTEALEENQSEYNSFMDQIQSEYTQWFDSVKNSVKELVIVRCYESTYTTAEDGETQIPINIQQYNINLDILQVFINGMKLIATTDYTISSNSQITLTKALCANTPVNFVVYKSEKE